MIVLIYRTLQLPALEKRNFIFTTLRISLTKFQKYVSSALAPVVKQATSTKLANKFYIKNAIEFFFDIVVDIDVKVAECKIKSFKKYTHVVGLEVTE